MSTTSDLRILATKPLISPARLEEELPLPTELADQIARQRAEIANVVTGRDSKLLVIVGPCSIHDPASAADYAARLAPVAEKLADDLVVVMRVYFEKPRTVVGWKGLINDPGLDGTFRINEGLRLARRVLLDVVSRGLPAATEFLDTTLGQYYPKNVSQSNAKTSQA